ncbi:MAG: phosphotransferase [Chloroflexota bacterium]|nr:phosphotransferase [Chloroflexota bacterium]
MSMPLTPPAHTLILNQLAGYYGIEPTQLHCLTDNLDDGVYGFTREGQDFVLKYTLQAARLYSTLQAQVDWVNFLAAHDAPVSHPVPSLHGVFVEQLPINDTFVSVICYECVPGERPEGTALTAELFQTWGEVLGKLHALSTQYTPPDLHAPIDHWDEGIIRDRQVIPADQTIVLKKYDALVEDAYALPKDQHCYGVIHGDVQANNLRIDQGVLRVIDFDNCAYNWFVTDLATSLYFTLWEPHPTRSNAAFAAFVLENMLVGYARERVLEAEWIDQLPIFLKRVEMNIYVAIHAYHQAAFQSNPAALPSKHHALLRRYRYQIEHDVPYIESAYNPWISD